MEFCRELDFFPNLEISHGLNWFCSTEEESGFGFPNLGISQGLNWFYSAQQETHNDKIMEVSPFDGFFELDWTPHLPYQSNHLSFNDFTALENFDFDLDFNLPALNEASVVDEKPLNIVMPKRDHFSHESASGEASVIMSSVKKENEEENREEPLLLPSPSNSCSKKKKSNELEYDEIKEHFGVPITVAAKKMNVGLTVLKKRCRKLNIKRWPHRKIKSLQLLIDNVKELGLTEEVAMLEKHKEMLENLPGLELDDDTKKLRQACFKANYKKRRSLALCA